MELIFKDVKEQVDQAILKHGNALSFISLTTDEYYRFKAAVNTKNNIIKGQFVYRKVTISRRRF